MAGDVFGEVHEVQQAISWNRFALLWIVALYLLQQVGLLYHIGAYSLSLLLLAVPDVVILLLLSLSTSNEYAAMEGGTCWVVYAWSLSVKYLIFFFVVYSGPGPYEGVVISGPCGGVLEVGLLLSLGAAVYALLAFRASETLFGGISHFSIDSMLHTDAVTHVLLDLIDGVAAFNTYAVMPKMILQQNSWLHILAGIVVPLSVFLHGYSFPSAGGVANAPLGLRRSAASSHAYGRDSGDMQTMRKHAAIVGVFFVDLPFLALRLFTWAYYPNYEGLSPFMFKNVCFIPIQLARLRHCALAIRLQRKAEAAMAAPEGLGASGAAASQPSGPHLPRSAAAVLALETLAGEVSLPEHTEATETVANKRHRGDNGLVGRHPRRQRKTSALPYVPVAGHAAPEALMDIPASNHQQQQQQRLVPRRSFAFWRKGTPGDDRTEETPETPTAATDDYQASLSRLVSVCQSATQGTRRLPAQGFAAKRVLQRLVYALRQLGSRHYAAVLISRSVPSSFTQSVRLGCPFMLHWICQLAITSTLYVFYNNRTDFPIGLYTLSVAEAGEFTWASFATETRVCLVLIGSYSVAMLLLFFMAAPLFDCLFLAIFCAVRLASFYLTVLTFRDFGVFADILQLASRGTVPDIGRYCIFIFAIEPLLGILVSLYPFISVLLGRETLTYIVASPGAGSKASKRSAAHGRPELDFAQADEQPRGDETETVCTASLMLFICCRSMVAPVSLHELLIGPNLIKAIRMSDGLLRAHWRRLLVSLVLRVWCCSLFFAFPASIANSENIVPSLEGLLGLRWFEVCSLASLVFAAHLLLDFLYLLFAQLTRLLAIKRVENKAIFRDLAEIAFDLKEAELRSALRLPAASEKPQDLSSSMLAIVDKFNRQCFFTSPGEIIPPFF